MDCHHVRFGRFDSLELYVGFEVFKVERKHVSMCKVSFIHRSAAGFRPNAAVVILDK